MKVPSWQHTKPLPQPTRHRMRGRTDFEDSLLSVRREEQAKERRKLEAMTAALKARGVASDPDGSHFQAARQKAIAARRVENARLQSLFQQPGSNQPDFAETRADDWNPEAEPARPARSLRLWRWTGVAALALGLCAGLAASLSWPA